MAAVSVTSSITVNVSSTASVLRKSSEESTYSQPSCSHAVRPRMRWTERAASMAAATAFMPEGVIRKSSTVAGLIHGNKNVEIAVSASAAFSWRLASQASAAREARRRPACWTILLTRSKEGASTSSKAQFLKLCSRWVVGNPSATA